MAEVLIAARDLPSGYRRGDPITVKPNNHTWGRAEGPPDFYVMRVPNLDEARAKSFLKRLTEPALFGDPEFNAPDPKDRVKERHRRRVRFDLDRLPSADKTELERGGRLARNVRDLRDVIRKQSYDRSRDEIVDDGQELPERTRGNNG